MTTRKAERPATAADFERWTNALEDIVSALKLRIGALEERPWPEPPAPEVLFCKDCRHCILESSMRRPEAALRYARCGAVKTDPAADNNYLVGLSHPSSDQYCSSERGYGACGRTGKNWEAKPPAPPKRRWFGLRAA